MIRMKEIKRLLDERDIEYEIENQRIHILSCDLGNNFYNYGEPKKTITIDDEQLKFLSTDFRVNIITCENCCCCSGW